MRPHVLLQLRIIHVNHMQRVYLNPSLFAVVRFQTTIAFQVLLRKQNGLPVDCIPLPMLALPQNVDFSTYEGLRVPIVC